MQGARRTRPLAAELVEVLLEGERATGVACPLAHSLVAASAAAPRTGAWAGAGLDSSVQSSFRWERYSQKVRSCRAAITRSSRILRDGPGSLRYGVRSARTMHGRLPALPGRMPVNWPAAS